MYGLKFKDSSSLSIERYMYANQDVVRARGGDVLGQAYHMKKMSSILWEKELVQSKWTDRIIEAFCHKDEVVTVMGGAGNGKSNTFGACYVADWWTNPYTTRTCVCSTSKKDLMGRVWEAVIRYWSCHKGVLPGKLSKAFLAIVPEDTYDEGIIKAGILGVAIKRGEVEDAISTISGYHLPYVRWLLDEMQSTPRAAFEAKENANKACKEFKLRGAGNPYSWNELLGEVSTPLGGITEVTVDDKSWPTKYGHCIHLDGLESPALEDPEKYFFLINGEQIERHRKHGMDTAGWYRMVRGFPPPQGMYPTVMSELLLAEYEMGRDPIWMEDPKLYASIDPSKTARGDPFVLTPFWVGVLSNGMKGVAFDQPKYINPPIDATIPRAIQLGRAVKSMCELLGIKNSKNIAIDDSATQTFGDIIEGEMGVGVYKENFGGWASGDVVEKIGDVEKTAKDLYDRRVTELYMLIRRYGRNGQIRGVRGLMARQITNRRMITDEHAHGKIKVETKKEYKAHANRESPDEGDTVVIALSYMNKVLGIKPGCMVATPDPRQREMERQAIREVEIAEDGIDEDYNQDGIDAA